MNNEIHASMKSSFHTALVKKLKPSLRNMSQTKTLQRKVITIVSSIKWITCHQQVYYDCPGECRILNKTIVDSDLQSATVDKSLIQDYTHLTSPWPCFNRIRAQRKSCFLVYTSRFSCWARVQANRSLAKSLTKVGKNNKWPGASKI